MTLRIDRAKFRRGSHTERFARIPQGALLSEAVTTLNHAAFKVLAVLAVQFHRTNNGSLALTEQFARQYGFKGRDTLYRSLRELESRGLIVCTRRGSKYKNHFSLYALNWDDIYYWDGQPLDRPRPANRSAWENWRKRDLESQRADAKTYRGSVTIDTDPRDCSSAIRTDVSN